MVHSISYSRKGVFFGVLILAIGLILLLDQMGYVSAAYVFRFFWPAVFIFFGIEIASCRNNPSRVLVGVLMLCFGVLLLFGALGVLHVGIYTLWPLLLIIWGVWVIGRAMGGGDSWRINIKGTTSEKSQSQWNPQSAADFAERIKTSIHENIKTNIENNIRSRVQDTVGAGGFYTSGDDAQFDHVAIFGGVKQRISVKNFRGGRLLAICGGFDIDLTRADIEGEYAVIEANALMGGGEIRVPDSWVVEFRGVPLLGGYSDETHQMIADPAKAKRLIIKGIACMGGVVVKN